MQFNVHGVKYDLKTVENVDPSLCNETDTLFIIRKIEKNYLKELQEIRKL